MRKVVNGKQTNDKQNYNLLTFGEELFGGYNKRKTKKIIKRKKSHKKKTSYKTYSGEVFILS
jgi:hypothetical protein